MHAPAHTHEQVPNGEPAVGWPPTALPALQRPLGTYPRRDSRRRCAMATASLGETGDPPRGEFLAERGRRAPGERGLPAGSDDRWLLSWSSSRYLSLSKSYEWRTWASRCSSSCFT